MAKKLINKLTRELTQAECLHVIQNIWGFERMYDEFESGEERREAKKDDAMIVQRFIADMFKKDGDEIQSVDDYFVGDQAWPLSMIVETLNYLHKKGILI